MVMILSGIALAATLTACGYKLAGKGDLPGGIQTIAVRILENRSSETGAETIFTNALINEVNRRRRGAVVGMDKADGILDGAIETIAWETVARKGSNTAVERKVYASLSLRLANRDGEILWQRTSLRTEQAYIVVDGDKAATESNRRVAINTLSEQMAEYVYRRLTDNF